MHVQVGDNDLGGEFNNPGSSASYNWVAYKDGTLDEFVDAELIAWAHAEGNSSYNSVGTQGFPNEPLTELACQTIAALYNWGHSTYGWPYQLADAPGQPGFGWHGMGGNAWGGHPDCPGDIRRGQRQHILDLAVKGDTDMTDEQAKMLQELHDMFFKPVDQVGAGVPWALSTLLNDLRAVADKLGVPRQ